MSRERATATATATARAEDPVRQTWEHLHKLWSEKLAAAGSRPRTIVQEERPRENDGDASSIGPAMMLANVVIQSFFGGAQSEPYDLVAPLHHSIATMRARAQQDSSAVGALLGQQSNHFGQQSNHFGQTWNFTRRHRRPPTSHHETILEHIQNLSLHEYQPNRTLRGGGSSLRPMTVMQAVSARSMLGSDALEAKKRDAEANDVPKCPICLETGELTASATDWSAFPCCRTPVHLACARTALERDRRCPMCRKHVP